ncbi:hypothetical protein U1Q18_030114 [Sarracenia purpurea var. burkii]
MGTKKILSPTVAGFSQPRSTALVTEIFFGQKTLQAPRFSLTLVVVPVDDGASTHIRPLKMGLGPWLGSSPPKSLRLNLRAKRITLNAIANTAGDGGEKKKTCTDLPNLHK